MSQYAALIPSSPLKAPDQLIHKDLKEWSNSLYGDLISLKPQISYNPSAACSSLNQAALIASLRGDLQAADQLCHIQLKWLAKELSVEKITVPELLAILQPWINLGRLHLIKKEYDQARPHFNMKEQLRREPFIDLNYVKIKCKRIENLLTVSPEGEDLSYFLWVNYINEYLKIFIKKHDYQAGLGFLKQQRENCPSALLDLLKEGEMILLEYLDDYDSVIKGIKSYRPQNAYSKLVFLYHLSLSYFLTNRKDIATKYCQRLARYIEKAFKESEFVSIKKFAIMVGKLCKELKLYKEAELIFLKGYKLSKKLGDQRYLILYVIELVKILSQSPKKSHDWNRILIDHLTKSDYNFPIQRKLLDHSAPHFNKLNAYVIQAFA